MERKKSSAWFFILLIASVSPVTGEHRLSGVQINPACVGASAVGVFASTFTAVLAALEVNKDLHPAKPDLPPPDPNDDKVNGDFADEGFADDPMTTKPVSDEEEECFMEMDLDPSHCSKSSLWHGLGTNGTDCFTACLPSEKPADCSAEDWADLHNTSIKKSMIHPNIAPDGSLLKTHNGVASTHPKCSGTVHPLGGSTISTTDEDVDAEDEDLRGRVLRANEIDDLDEFIKSLDEDEMTHLELDETALPVELSEEAQRKLGSSRRRRRRRRRRSRPHHKIGSRIKKDVNKAVDAVKTAAKAVVHFTKAHAKIIKKVVKKVLVMVAVVVAISVLTVVTAGAADAVVGAIAGAAEVTDAVVDTTEVADTVATTVEATDAALDTANAVKDGDDVVVATEDTKNAAEATKDGKDAAEATKDGKGAAEDTKDGKDVKNTEDTAKDTKDTDKDTTEENEDCKRARRLCEANSGHARRLCEQATRKLVGERCQSVKNPKTTDLLEEDPSSEVPNEPEEEEGPKADSQSETSIDSADKEHDFTEYNKRPEMTEDEKRANMKALNRFAGEHLTGTDRAFVKAATAGALYGNVIIGTLAVASVATAVGFSIDAVVKKVNRGGFGCRSENHRCAVGDCCSTLACKRKTGYAEPVCQAVSTPSPTHPPTGIPAPDQVPTTFPTMAPTVLTCPMCVSQKSTWCLANGLCYGKGTLMPSVCSSASGCANNLKPSVCNASCTDEPPTSAVDLGTDKLPTMPQAQPQVRVYDNSTTTPVYANITFCLSVNASYLASQNLTVKEAKLGISPVINSSALRQGDFGGTWRVDMYRPVSSSRSWEGDFEYYKYSSITLKFPNSTLKFPLVEYPPTAKSPGMQDGDCVDAFPMDQTK